MTQPLPPEMGDSDVWASILRAIKQICEGLSFATPFIGPAFLGAILSVSRKAYRHKSKIYWFSAVAWSTLAGALLAPLFSHTFGIPLEAAGSSASFIALIGHEALNMIIVKYGGGERDG